MEVASEGNVNVANKCLVTWKSYLGFILKSCAVKCRRNWCPLSLLSLPIQGMLMHVYGNNFETDTQKTKIPTNYTFRPVR